ncbi:major histocompatibility complex class I-related gene protein-like [Epinephelus fuscoguttatus]|uniref:major histocompatibility complex class I-related gene protein-like n=1 Tax=Epinephelus fuscoguttatus TaxID=293821 RepID=UPI0020D17AA6|nr:major histocompatibility complex class I-related gene protein-like [Epinephelus fuscoguttatus]
MKREHHPLDFLTFDLDTESWVASKPQAVITKHFWDRQRARNELWKNYLTQFCPEWLRKHLNFGRSFLLRTGDCKIELLFRSFTVRYCSTGIIWRLSLDMQPSLSVSPPEVSLLSSQLPRYRFLPR